MRIVVVLGGSALRPSEGSGPAASGNAPVQRAAKAVAQIAAHHAVAVTHGNGPQLGWLSLQTPAPGREGAREAAAEGMIGYMLERALMAALPGRRIATLLTQVEVNPADAAFRNPSLQVGPAYDADKAARIAAECHWIMGGEGERFRRLVASPMPLRIVELETVRMLCERNVVVVCAGGGGIPVVIGTGGDIRGVEAVVDQDRTAALLGEGLSADFLLMLTAVDAVYTGWNTAHRRPIRRATPDRLLALSLESGSIGPKVEAACDFVTRTGGSAAIGALDCAADVLRGAAGTLITAGKGELDYREG